MTPPVSNQSAARADLRAGDMKEHVTPSHCHQFILGRTNYWAHDAEVDSSPKARQQEVFSRSVKEDTVNDSEAGGGK